MSLVILITIAKITTIIIFSAVILISFLSVISEAHNHSEKAPRFAHWVVWLIMGLIGGATIIALLASIFKSLHSV